MDSVSCSDLGTQIPCPSGNLCVDFVDRQTLLWHAPAAQSHNVLVFLVQARRVFGLMILPHVADYDQRLLAKKAIY